MSLEVYGESLSSRMFLGTAQYPSPSILADAVRASGAEVVTVSLRREQAQGQAGGRYEQQVKKDQISAAALPPTEEGQHQRDKADINKILLKRVAGEAGDVVAKGAGQQQVKPLGRRKRVVGQEIKTSILGAVGKLLEFQSGQELGGGQQQPTANHDRHQQAGLEGVANLVAIRTGALKKIGRNSIETIARGR